MGIEHLSSLGRNDPCWCGSEQKYKKCHLSEDEALRRAEAPPPEVSPAAPSAAAARTAPAAPQPEIINRKVMAIIGAISFIVLVLVTILRDFGDGLIAAAAALFIGVGYLILRNPPPPHRDKSEGAQLNFGISPPKEVEEQPTRTRVVRGHTPPPPRTRRKPR